MKAKKAKDLEAELIGDLLSEDVDDTVDQESARPKSNAETQKSMPVTSAEGGPLQFGFGSEEDQGGDETLKLAKSKVNPGNAREPSETVPAHRGGFSQSTKTGTSGVQVSVGRYGARMAGAGAEISLAQSENLRIAQQKIFDLESEIQRLRLENEELASAGETIKNRADGLMGQVENLQRNLDREKETAQEEKEILLGSLSAKDKDLRALQEKTGELENRLSSNIQKIRVRERELENRLELMRMENAALMRNKDEMILELKRQLDRVNLEIENYRAKGQDLNRQLGDHREMMRRAVKALRITLSMLEGVDGAEQPLKKVD